jgi:hypothetical protein
VTVLCGRPPREAVERRVLSAVKRKALPIAAASVMPETADSGSYESGVRRPEEDGPASASAGRSSAERASAERSIVSCRTRLDVPAGIVSGAGLGANAGRRTVCETT